MSNEIQEYPRSSQSRNSPAPGITEEYIAQVSEEIEGRATKKLSQEFSKTESRILGALSKLDEFLLNRQVRTFFGTVPRTLRNYDVKNQEPSGDRSQKNPHPEGELSACAASNLTDSDLNETPQSYRITKSSPRIFCRHSDKIQCGGKNRHSVPFISKCICGIEEFFDNLISVIFIWQAKFVYLIPTSDFYSIQFCLNELSDIGFAIFACYRAKFGLLWKAFC